MSLNGIEARYVFKEQRVKKTKADKYRYDCPNNFFDRCTRNQFSIHERKEQEFEIGVEVKKKKVVDFVVIKDRNTDFQYCGSPNEENENLSDF